MLLRTIIDVIIRHPKLIKRCAIVNCIKFIKRKKLHNYIKLRYQVVSNTTTEINVTSAPKEEEEEAQ